MLSQNTPIVLGTLLIQGLFFARFPKIKFLIYIFPAAILLYGVYDCYILGVINPLEDTLLYMGAAAVMYWTGYRSRRDFLKKAKMKGKN